VKHQALEGGDNGILSRMFAPTKANAEGAVLQFHKQDLVVHFEPLKVLVWLALATLPWMALYAFGHKLFGV